MFVIFCLSIFATSIFFSMLGLGGGGIFTPIQVWFGIDMHIAATTSLFLIMVTSISATMIYHKAQKIDWPLAIVLESITALGSFLGGFYSDLFSTKVLSYIFCATVGTIALFMLNGTPKKHEHAKKYFWKRQVYSQGNTEVYYINVPLAMTIGLFAGAFSGLLGIGGGILKIPLMVMLLGVPIDIAVGTSAFMVGVTALGGFTGHYFCGHWDYKTSLILACFVFVGSQIGARMSIISDKTTLKKTCALLLLFVALAMLIFTLQQP